MQIPSLTGTYLWGHPTIRQCYYFDILTHLMIIYLSNKDWYTLITDVTHLISHLQVSLTLLYSFSEAISTALKQAGKHYLYKKRRNPMGQRDLQDLPVSSTLLSRSHLVSRWQSFALCPGSHRDMTVRLTVNLREDVVIGWRRSSMWPKRRFSHSHTMYIQYVIHSFKNKDTTAAGFRTDQLILISNTIKFISAISLLISRSEFCGLGWMRDSPLKLWQKPKRKTQIPLE